MPETAVDALIPPVQSVDGLDVADVVFLIHEQEQIELLLLARFVRDEIHFRTNLRDARLKRGIAVPEAGDVDLRVRAPRY